jgi:hypothetical protein
MALFCGAVWVVEMKKGVGISLTAEQLFIKIEQQCCQP